ncbi:MAG: pyruvate, phosphate dikinase [Planctomycetota bacterium]|nr:MAG: pyruvate, phosphate dikinase [Planctomycetota bacterium]
MPEGWTTDRNILGGKGAGLARMSEIGLPVPPGFTITTEVCTYYMLHRDYPETFQRQTEKAMKALERSMGRKFGHPKRPLLVSVRSGARVSMPGMMDTVLNLGLNSETIQGLIADSGNARFAWDAYRRFVAMYGDVVLGLCQRDHNPFEEILEARKRERLVRLDTELDAEDLQAVTEASLAYVEQAMGKPFPSDPHEQLDGAVRAVFESWNNDRAVAYRRMNGIPDDWGTAVNVQAMVFGNLGADSGTGVAFTRDPATGENRFYGEYLMNAQGEDVVAGTRTPHPMEDMEQEMPAIYGQLLKIRKVLEREFGDMQDLEFTIERGKLYILQTRAGKRTGAAAIRIATDLVKERRISQQEALRRIDPESITQLLSPVFDGSEKQQALDQGRLLATGLNAGPGAATGRIVFSAEDAVNWAERGESVLLVRPETSPEDIRGMEAAAGILTQHGGMTSHAALVARQMGRVCVAGCGEINIDLRAKRLQANGQEFQEGDWLSLDGSTGQVIAGQVHTQASRVIQVIQGKAEATENGDDARFRLIMQWADRARRLKVRANADQPDQAQLAVALGAEGIGLCRTEHMFFGEGKLLAMQRMILAADADARRAALEEILPLQRQDFEGILEAMGSRPVTVRTLDPPLHEFLPHTEADAVELAAKLGVDAEEIHKRVAALHEANPMLGFRGCRLTSLVPEILEIQITALLQAAASLRQRKIRVQPEIMIPLVGHRDELGGHERQVRAIAKRVFKEAKVKVPYTVGTMIEVPRAALTAYEVAEVAEFFSFGTNDLTQTTLAMSRDDSGSFLPAYVEAGLYDRDPFSSIDQNGVGRLMEIAVEEGRRQRPDLKIGICGEHGGDPASVEYCHRLQLDYVSCSPYRLPVARLAAARAAINTAPA